MGVPKFYRWISERYPKINQIISDLMLMPEFDNLYLDMNGIIHHCTHPNDDDLAAALSEKDVMLGIFNYIDRIVTQIAKPRKVLFMAVDGVAPRAKLNQQRSRRFASAKDREIARQLQEHKSGDSINPSDCFDSNCITPGTSFMQRVSEHLVYFIQKKQHEDPLWKRLTIIFSGHEVPGEGEHKIMQHIRELRADPNHDPNTSHCMYGQDADLIMLGLVSHEPHFTLLREVINFQQGRKSGRDPKNVKKTVMKQTNVAEFQLLHISILREYLQIELCQELYLAQAPIDLERVIDDFVFLTFLVGNDFLPHLPSLDISEGAFDRLFNTYKLQLKQAHEEGEGGLEKGYLTLNGTIPNFQRLETFLMAIGAMEDDIFKERAANEAEFAARRKKWDKRDGKNTEAEDEAKKEMEKLKSGDFESALQKERNAITSATGAATSDIGDNNIDTTTSPLSLLSIQQDGDSSFEYMKGRYYYDKFGILPNHNEVHEAIRCCYLEGLLWCLGYYFRGCLSWSWFYPFHYGPMMSDMINLDTLISKQQIKISSSTSTSTSSLKSSDSYDYGIFVKGRPFLPFQQLLGCLPAGSKSFLPKPYQFLMDSENSPIIDFYPKDFKVDMNGKRNPWEGVNLLPFIDSKRMMEALEMHCPPNTLTKDEQKRNTFGDPIEFYYDESAKGVVIKSVNSAIGLPDLSGCRIKSKKRPDLIFDRTDVAFEAELKKGCIMPFAGFPSLHVLPIPQASLKPIKINCFGTESRYSTFTLSLPVMPIEQIPSIEILYSKILGSTVFVNWPMMHEGKIIGISNDTCCYKLVSKNQNQKYNSKNKFENIISSVGKVKKNKQSNNKDVNNNNDDDDDNDNDEEIICEKYDDDMKRKWNMKSMDIQDEYLKGRGICGGGGVDIGKVYIRLTISPLQGMSKNHMDGSRNKIFASSNSESIAELPMQIAIWNNPTLDVRFMESGPMELEELAPINSESVIIHPQYCTTNTTTKNNTSSASSNQDKDDIEWSKYHGRKGYVQGHNKILKSLTIKIPKFPIEPSFGIAIANSIVEKYFPTGAVAKIVGLRPEVLGKVLGSLSVDIDRNESYDLGLRLKLNESAGSETPCFVRVLGYMRVAESETSSSQYSHQKSSMSNQKAWISDVDSVRIVGSGNPAGSSSGGRTQTNGASGASGGGAQEKAYMKWELSVKGVQLLKAYMTKFPDFFNALGKSSDRYLNAASLFKYDPRGSSVALTEIVEWLSELEVMKLPRAPLTSEALPSDAVKAIQRAADVRTNAFATAKLDFESLEVPLSSLTFAPSLNTLRDVKFNYNKSMGAPVLGDRVVNIHATAVPFGIKGTVVARHFHSSAVEVVFDEVFVGGNSLQGMCDKFRGKLLPWNHLLKIPPNTPESNKPTPPAPPPPVPTEQSTIQPKQVQPKPSKGNTKDNGKKAKTPVPPPPPPAPTIGGDGSDDEEVVMVSPRLVEANKTKTNINQQKTTSTNKATNGKSGPNKNGKNKKNSTSPPQQPQKAPDNIPLVSETHSPSSDNKDGGAPILNENVRNLFVGFNSSTSTKTTATGGTDTNVVVVNDIHDTGIASLKLGDKDEGASASLLSMLKKGPTTASSSNTPLVKDEASAALLSMLKQGGGGGNVQDDGASAALLSMLKGGGGDTNTDINTDTKSNTTRKLYREAKRPEENSLGFQSGGRGKNVNNSSNGPTPNDMLSEADIINQGGGATMDPLQELLANAQFENSYN